MGINFYDRGGLSFPVAVESAQLADATLYDFNATSGEIGTTGVHAIRLAGGVHPTGGTAHFGIDSTQGAANDEASLVAYAVKRIGDSKCLVRSLWSSAITLDFGTKAFTLGGPGGEDVPLLMADEITTPTLAGFGAALEAKYSAFTPEVTSPGSNGLASILFASLPAMWGIAFDLYGTGEHDRYVLWEPHS